jgi:hypothetical protein
MAERRDPEMLSDDCREEEPTTTVSRTPVEVGAASASTLDEAWEASRAD